MAAVAAAGVVDEEVVAAVEVAVGVARAGDPVAWVAQKRPDREAAASAPSAGTGRHTRWENPATNRPARAAARP